MQKEVDVLVIGAGQAGLAKGIFLGRDAEYLINKILESKNNKVSVEKKDPEIVLNRIDRSKGGRTHGKHWEK
ncbi:hypothetical protein [Brevibacillus agri]|uniref:hypothetical protein n=1 Tax=Brevibacillus agri TaxID=51101 RepID=UPI003D2401F7